jgi:uncharacterized protein YybS (DUF2232 family)
VSRKAVIGLVRAAALSGALFLAVAAIPIVGGFAMLFAPAPILIFAVGRLSPNLRATISVLLAGGLVAIAAGISAGVTYGVSFGLATMLMCYMLERRYSFELIVLVTAGMMLIAGTAAALVAAGSPDAMLTAIHQSLKAGMGRGQDFYKAIGMDAGLPPDTQATAIDIFIRLSPALAAIAAAATVMLNLTIFWRWAGKKRLAYDLFGELPKWSTPEWLIWVLLAAGFAYQGFKYLIPIKPIETIALDAFLCVAMVYFCQGLAIMSYYFRMLGMPAVARVAIYVITCVQPVLAVLVCLAGVLDLWVDFRRLKPPSQEAGNFSDFL